MTTLDILPEVTCPPTDLWSDEPPLESDLHLQQITILIGCLERLWQERSNYYASMLMLRAILPSTITKNN
ncbi:gll0726 protein [Microcystis aeruginosa NIES-44]|jgi:Uma2 family endonuclease|uniref:Gll0726 protein n=1 Tax=Microcystis aeruginosa NIES-44 TaxID=449439 RepID=A0A0A1VYL6_MICAE|nr:gll0726 protein [Microcystis aeruginosa NIES-44]